MDRKPISHTFNRQTICGNVTVKGKTETVTAGLVIEAAEPVILTQDVKLLGQPGHQYVLPTANLWVYGDVVTIKGELRLPGRDILIVARKLLAVPAEHKDAQNEAAAITVDGPPLEDEVGKPKALLKGANPPDNPAKGKVKKGQSGGPAYNTRIEPYPEPGSSWSTGGAGWSGPDHPAEMNGENGHEGAPGNRGGAVSILCGTLTVDGAAVLPISTIGGPGGNGQSGQDGADGGDGGAGFNAVGQAGVFDMGYKNSTAGGNGGQGGAGGKGARGGQGGSGGEVQVHVLSGEPPVSAVTRGGAGGEGGWGGNGGNPGGGGSGGLSAERAGYGTVRVIAGSPGGSRGTLGSSFARGDPALPSKDGSATLSHGKLAPGVVTSNASVSQVVMMFERVRADYLATGPDGDPEAFADIKERLGWVTALLRGVAKSHEDFALASAVFPAAVLALTQADSGYDYFGNDAYHVPSVSVGAYRGLLQTSLGRLAAVEQVADDYIRARREESDALASLHVALGHAKAQQGSLQEAADSFARKLKAEADTIYAVEIRRQAARKPLEAKLDEFALKVKNSFGLSPETFFNCLTQLSFTSVENPPGAAAMIAGQLGAIVTEGLKNITDDSGQLVNKKYVLGTIKSFNSAELKTDFENTPTGEINDSASYHILAEFAKIKRMVDDFREKTPGAAEASLAIMDYIALLAERNRHIDYYNGLLRGWVQIRAEAQRVALDQQKVQDGLAQNTPGLTPMVNFISGLYERAKADCIESLYMLSRAQSFWALEPLTSFYAQLGHTPQNIRHAQLVTAALDIDNNLKDVLDHVRLTPNHFPAGDKGDHAQGALVVLTRKTHGDFFTDLEDWGEAQFALAPATRQSPAPDTILTPTMSAWTGKTGKTPPGPAIANPFHGKADVRLTKVRAWMVGMRTKTNLHHITIEHMGWEVFRTRDDTAYPEPRQDDESELVADGQPSGDRRSMIDGELPGDHRSPRSGSKEHAAVKSAAADARIAHTPVQLPFIYSAEGLEFDGHFTPGKIHGVPGSEDGDLGYSGMAELGLPGTTGYAAIGPFATWRLIVRKQDNPELDLTSLHTVVMDFHGFHKSFRL